MKLILVSFFVFFIGTINKTFGQNCNSQFSSHKNGAIIANWPESISGIAKAPIGGHVWVLGQRRVARKVGRAAAGSRGLDRPAASTD